MKRLSPVSSHSEGGFTSLPERPTTKPPRTLHRMPRLNGRSSMSMSTPSTDWAL